ncbi:TPA: hypothetical protein DEP96_03115 [Candidatus Uhrbacteria bacterium]|nr:hypothetical protein [Candidatus Uhrbacteria bacterium]
MLKLHFEPNLQYQLDAIAAVTGLFAGAPYIRPEERLFEGVCANKVGLSDEEIWANRDRIAENNGIIEVKAMTDMDFSIEMETGTGKTYVYLRTIFELNKVYGLSKFIILVPSIAIKEGVLSTLRSASEHFKALYGVNYRAFAYDSKKPAMVRGYAQSGDLQIMVMNTQAFVGENKIINQLRDSNGGERLIDLIGQVQPVIILDEPQKGMDTDKATEQIANGLKPILKLRYSATHKVLKNLIYQLTPFDAYSKKLVKQVEVLSVHEQNTESSANIAIKSVDFVAGKQPAATLEVMVRLAGGEFKLKNIKVGKDTDLAVKTNNLVYDGWVVERIWKDMNDEIARVRFTNGEELKMGASRGEDKEAVFREQIRLTVVQHFKKKEKLQEQGIKVLSLFFIDRVANYQDENGLIRRLFVEAYSDEYKKKYGVYPMNTTTVHNGYFAKTGKGEWTDSESAMSKNAEVFDLIMRDKERLLSFAEPLEFIFSHSALGVGWDNPNIFNICTLNETQSAIQKRQEIGRGLRICVDQTGNRVRDPEKLEEGLPVNVLTVIPNQSYEGFVAQYQAELAVEYGDVAKDLKIVDARKVATTVKRNEAVFESSDFDRLWEVISRKTKFTVHFDENLLISECIRELDKMSVPKPMLQTKLGRINFTVGKAGETSIASEYIGESAIEVGGMSASKINLVSELADESTLSESAVQQILAGMKDKKKVAKNPVAFLAKATLAAKKIVKQTMVRCVSYEALNESWDKSEFKEMFETRQDVLPVQHGVYDHVVFDSRIEERFGQEIDNENRVRCFIKLPEWYKIKTPAGDYNPDWALVIEKKTLDDEVSTKYSFVVETKGFDAGQPRLDEDERAKIACAIAHFKAIGLEDYYVTETFPPLVDVSRVEEMKASNILAD